MPYLGNNLEAAFKNYKSIDDISSSFNGSTTSFALQVNSLTPVPFPRDSQNCLISIGGVIQKPDATGTTGFKLTGTNIVFSSAPAIGESFFGVILAGADYVNAGVNYPDGTAGAPSITWSDDTDTGFYRSGAGTTAVTANGTQVLEFPSSTSGTFSVLSKLAIGTTSASTPLHVRNTATDLLKLDCNDAGALGAHLQLNHDSSSPADDDVVGAIEFSGKDSNGNGTIYSRIRGVALDVTDGTEDGALVFGTRVNSSFGERMRINGQNVGIGTTLPGSLLELNAANDTAQLKFLRTGTTIGGTINTRDESGSKGLTYTAQDANSAAPQHCFQTNDGSAITERFRITQDGTIHVNSADSASGGRLYAASSAMYIQDGNGRQTFKVSDPGSGNSYTWELTSDGNLKAPNGKGIDFSATADGTTMSSETLDDYEEGNFTPAFSHGATASGYDYQKGYYTKVGNKVFATFYIRANAGVSTNGNDLRISGLPFTSNSTAQAEGGGFLTFTDGFFGTTAANYTSSIWIPNASTYLLFYKKTDGVSIKGNECTVDAKYVIGQIIYTV